MEKMNVLIVGGAGYIGSHLAVEHLNKNHNVIIVDNLTNSNEFILENIKKITDKEFTFYAYNASNENLMDSVFDEHDIDLVVHLASDVSSSKSIDNPLQYLDNNINSLLTIIKLMLKYEVKKMIYGSSSKVYGKGSDKQISESIARKLGDNPYAVSKQICEDIIMSMDEKINVAIMRYFNPIGCHESGLLGSIPKAGNDNIVNSLYDSYLNNNQFKLNGDNYKTVDGTCVRDYISIHDLVKSHMKTIAWIMDSNETQAFNICSGKGISVKEIIELFESKINEKLNVVVGSRRKGGIDNIIGNPEKAATILNFTSNNKILESILEYKKWYEYITKKNEEVK